MNKIDLKISEYIDRAFAIIQESSVCSRYNVGEPAIIEVAKMIQDQEQFRKMIGEVEAKGKKL